MPSATRVATVPGPRAEALDGTHPTQSPCPTCGALAPAEIFAVGGDWLMRRRCVACGDTTFPFKRDASFHQALRATVDRRHERSSGAVFWPLGDQPPPASDIKIDVTERCNYTCPACFSRSSPESSGGVSFELIRRELGRFAASRIKPDVSLIGGEPTLRGDLPDIVRWLTDRGFSVKLNTNGHLLVNRDLVERLRAAGLRWVILQFDGFDDAIHRITRHQDSLTARKLEAIRVLSDAGMQIVLVATVVRGVNDHQMGTLIDFGLRHERVVQVAFLPVANLGRSAFGEGAPQCAPSGDYDLAEFLDQLAADTGGRVTKRDFLEAAQLWTSLLGFAGRLLRGRTFGIQPKTCLMATFVIGRPGDYVSLNRLARPAVALASWRRAPDVARAVKSILGWKRGAPIRSLVGVYVEKFLDETRMDWAEVRNCTKYYLTEHGYVTDCAYNCLVRGKSATLAGHLRNGSGH